VNEAIIGMAHRGRLNVISCVIKRPYNQMFAEFEGVNYKAEQNSTYKYSGDVKYHLGASNILNFDGKEMKVTLMPNPSHLETVNAVAAGVVKAQQVKKQDVNGSTTIPIIIHGDAAIAGQGINYEMTQMEKLEHYEVGGTIHIVFNNQVGFTTNPVGGRSGFYATNIARINSNPVIHVNADDPEAVDHAMETAIKYRSEFKGDFFIDLIGYRRFGHNELDNAQFTQPEAFEKIQNHPHMYKIYGKQLIDEGVITQEEFDGRLEKFMDLMTQEHQKTLSDHVEPDNQDPYGWNEVLKSGQKDTGVEWNTILELNEKINKLPEDFNANRTLKKTYTERYNSIKKGEDMDWGTAEQLAFATLLHEGHSVRLSGEDVERGTFTHRHAVLNDMKDYSKYMPLNSVIADKSKTNLTIVNSPLSEYGVLGFEYGHSLANPYGLTIWEAQFGDFTNGAQIILDQYIMTAEKKWFTKSNIMLLLPHGYDGQGPEHSSARPERFLANIVDDISELQADKNARQKLSPFTNAIILNVTNPANFFHAIRRQIHSDYRKPVVFMSPKRLFKDKRVRSKAAEFLPDQTFKRVYPEDEVDHSKVRKVLFCSGQIYFDLHEYRQSNKIDDVAIIRLEQLAPFPYMSVEKAILNMPKDAQFCWVSEEHFNFGAYTFVQPRLQIILSELGFSKLSYAGRAISATTATGSTKQHLREVKELLKDAFA